MDGAASLCVYVIQNVVTLLGPPLRCYQPSVTSAAGHSSARPRVLEREPPPGDLAHDPSAVVVAQAPGQLLVVHAGIVGALAPEERHFVRAVDLELEVVVGPLDEVRVGGDEQQLQKELPQLELAAWGWHHWGKEEMGCICNLMSQFLIIHNVSVYNQCGFQSTTSLDTLTRLPGLPWYLL